MESKATLNAASYEAITAALRPAAVVPAPPWCTWKQWAKMDKKFLTHSRRILKTTSYKHMGRDTSSKPEHGPGRKLALQIWSGPGYFGSLSYVGCFWKLNILKWQNYNLSLTTALHCKNSQSWGQLSNKYIFSFGFATGKKQNSAK